MINHKTAKSSCCKAKIRLSKDNPDKGDTVYYVCTKCEQACNINNLFEELFS